MLTQVSLIYHTEPKAKKSGKEKNQKVKNGYAQKYRYLTVREIRAVSPGKEKERYDGKD